VAAATLQEARLGHATASQAMHSECSSCSLYQWSKNHCIMTTTRQATTANNSMVVGSHGGSCSLGFLQLVLAVGAVVAIDCGCCGLGL